MKVRLPSLLAVIALIFCFNASAQDIIYTISGEIDHQTTPLDSISVENLTSQSSFGFGELPERDDYRINLTQKKYWGSTSVYDLAYDNSLYLLENQPGLVSVGFSGQTATNASITLYNINGQKLLAKNNLTLDNGSLVEVEINHAGVYLLCINTPRETKTFKAIGASKSGQLAIALQNNSATPLKSGQLYHVDKHTHAGDNIKIRVFKNNYVAAPIEITVEKDTSLVFPLDSVTAPTVQTLDASDILSNSATLNGTILNDGHGTISERGFYWSATNENPGEADSIIVVEDSTGSFSAELSGLELNTTYYVRAFANNSKGKAYGEQMAFTTESWLRDTQTTIVDVTSPATGRTWMDRNLGASRAATSSTDAQAYGDYYQWGRAADGHQKRNSYVTSLLSNTDTPGHGNFIEAPNSPYDWRNPQNPNLWQGVNGVNNPCPKGYRIPTSSEWADEFRSWSSSNSKGAFESPLKLTLQGRRAYRFATMADIGSEGHYWTNKVDNDRIWYMRFSNWFIDEGVIAAYVTSGVRADGIAVRCIRDSETQATKPTVETTNIRILGSTAATLGGNVISDGGASVTARGVCWNTTGNPSVSDNQTTNGTGAGTFFSNITGLTQNTTYYVRAYAINSQGIVYGSVVQLTTCSSNSSNADGKDTATQLLVVTNPATGLSWMDRNLGASRAATSSTDAEAYGDLYQWGRAADGHQKRYSSTTSTLSNIDIPCDGNFIIINSGSNGDWRMPINDNLWQGVNGINNPCPNGFRLPTEAELDAERQSWSSNNAAGAFDSPLKLPVAGSRYYENGALGGVGSNGTYWSSTIPMNSFYSRGLHFNSSNAKTNSHQRTHGYSVRCLKDSETQAFLPSITTTSISNITRTNAVSGGIVTSDGGANITARGICWNTTGNPTIADSKATNGTGTGTFASNITGLAANTTYYVRAYATNSVGTEYGEQRSFTTAIALMPPTVNTASITNITQTTAICGGVVTFDGLASVTARGVCWNTTGNPTIDDNKTTNGTGTGTFSSNITGLTANTTYYVRAYATNSEGTSYGNAVQFKTIQELTVPTIITTNISNITISTATSGGNVTSDGGAAITTRGVCWNTTGNPTIANSKTTNGTDVGIFTSSITGLTANTTYYLRAYATNSQGTAYGEQKSFTTSISLCNALDNCILNFTLRGNAEWFAQTAVSYYGGSSAQSGRIGSYQSSTLETTVTGPGLLCFYWKVSSKSSFDELDFYIGTTLKDNISGDKDWQLKEYEITEGAHTLMWHYSKKGSGSSGQDCGWLDKITFSPAEPTLPTIITTNIINFGSTSAISGGKVISTGFAMVSSQGVCWNTTGSPTIDDSKTIDDEGAGTFSSYITGLTANNTYYVRAYITNSLSTAYGEQVIFKTRNEGDDGWQRDTETAVVPVTNPATGKTWMDRNLGASRAAISSTDTEAYGDLYQWGRAADGHQKRNSSTTITLSSSDTPGHGNFILSNISTNWNWRSPPNNHLWQSVGGINNPCPNGYRLPTFAEWENEYLSWGSNNADGAFASPLKLPLAGLRDSQNGSLLDVDSYGSYWSGSEVNDHNASYLGFNSSTADTGHYSRADGYSVRCIKD